MMVDASMFPASFFNRAVSRLFPAGVGHPGSSSAPHAQPPACAHQSVGNARPAWVHGARGGHAGIGAMQQHGPPRSRPVQFAGALWHWGAFDSCPVSS
jgi:hypothetical protein